MLLWNSEQGILSYKETIAQPVEGVGHFEPLRHYAEVHLLLEPGERGSGLQFFTACSEDVLDKNWQRLILPSGGTGASWGTYRRTYYRYADHFADRPCTSEAYRRRRFPPGNFRGLCVRDLKRQKVFCWSHIMIHLGSRQRISAGPWLISRKCKVLSEHRKQKVTWQY